MKTFFQNRNSNMAPYGLRFLAILLCSGASARAGSLVGFADGLTTASAGGWACISDGQAKASVAAYAGSRLLGIYPMTVNRPDLTQICPGSAPHGFAFPIDPATQALFLGQTQLALYAMAPGLPPLLLPSSNTKTLNPLPLPTGQLLGLASSQGIAVTASSGIGAPLISLFAAGPMNENLGTESGIAQPAAAGGYALQLPVSGLTLPAAESELLPVFGIVTNGLGATAPLAAPLALPLSGTMAASPSILPVNATFAQTGTYNAIRNNVFTQWLPPNTGFGGLTGSVSLAGNNASFDEALVILGTAPYDQADCLAQNGESMSGFPPLSRLWAGILKSNAAGSVSVPINFALPYPVAGQPGGSCLMTLVSAGYAYLSGNYQQYATTKLAAQASFVPVTATTPTVIPFGLGGEFRFTGAATPTSVYVGIMATKPLALDGIAGTASAAPVTGPAADPAWRPAPQGNWIVKTSFIYLPASVCAKANLNAQPTNGTFAVLRNGTASAIAIPAGAVPIMGMPMHSAGSQAIQRSAYAAFPPGPERAMFRGTLQTGDCLVAYSTAAIEPNAVLDVENQSTVFLRVLQ